MTSLPRFGQTAPDMTDAADMEVVSDALVAIDAKAMMYGQGLLAARPGFGVAGRVYWATDVNGGTFYYDTGAAWITPRPGDGTVDVDMLDAKPICRIDKSGVQVPSGTTQLTGFTTVINVGGDHDNAADSITVQTPGIYRIQGSVMCNSTTGALYCQVKKNGNTIAAGGTEGDGTHATSALAIIIEDLSASDVLTLFVTEENNNTIVAGYGTHLSIEYIGSAS